MVGTTSGASCRRSNGCRIKYRDEWVGAVWKLARGISRWYSDHDAIKIYKIKIQIKKQSKFLGICLKKIIRTKVREIRLSGSFGPIHYMDRVVSRCEIARQKFDARSLFFASLSKCATTPRGTVVVVNRLVIKNDCVAAMIIFLVAKDIDGRSYLRQKESSIKILFFFCL